MTNQWSHLEASRQYLLFTMYQNRHATEATCNLCISPKDNVFRQSLNQPPDQFGTLDCIGNQERSAKSTLFGTLDRAMRSRKVCQTIQDGGACRDRTDDPLLAKQVLSQLS